MTGKVSYTLGCFGFRQFVKIKPEDVIFGIPFEKLDNVVENLELLLELRPDLVELLAGTGRSATYRDRAGDCRAALAGRRTRLATIP